MSKQEIEKVRAHFMETLGNIPEPIRAMIDHAPEAMLGYLRMREWIYADNGHLDLKTKELIYTLCDVICGNLDGAKNHAQAGVKAGMTTGELAEGCMQVMAVFGIQTWGMTGWKLLDYVAELEKSGKKKSGKKKRG